MFMPIPSTTTNSCQKVRVIFDVFTLKKIIAKRASIRGAKELMSAENPPRIYHTEDNIEWKFVQTFANYDQMNKFRLKNQCIINPGREKHRRLRLPCKRKRHNCEFKLLAMKTTKKGYHVYQFGEHNNHPAINPKGK
jgi:hypothetical protein